MTWADRINLTTKWLLIGIFLLLAVWQIALIVMRWRGLNVRLISMQAQALGYAGLTSIVFAWFGLGTHWWICWRHSTWSSAIPGVIFWALLVTYVVVDLTTTYRHDLWPDWLEVARFPPLVAGIAMVSGYAFFPQKIPWVP